MANGSWTGSLRRSGRAALVAAAVAGLSIVMADGADRSGAPVAGLPELAEPTAAVWSIARAMVATPVRLQSLGETAPLAGRWFDHQSLSAVVDGREGTMIIARDFGASDEVDALTLLDRVAPVVHGVTVGFKPEQSDAPWFWVRYAPNGSVMSGTDGRPMAGTFHGSADGQCIAQSWSGRAPSS